MEEEIDVLGIDQEIRKNFEQQLQEYDNSSEEYADIEKEYNVYLSKVLLLLEEYKNVLKKPIKMRFIGKPNVDHKRKKQIIRSFADCIPSEYHHLIHSQLKKPHTNIVCNNCSNKKNFDIVDENVYTCLECYTVQTIVKHTTFYKELYDRKIHFRDCIKQYQGTQNSTVSDEVYRRLEECFERHHLLIDSTEKSIRFQRITKNHVLLFLKELNYSNHYENVNLIHFHFTGIRPADISHLEDKLMDDFNKLTTLYDKKFKHIDRKNFINTQYVLYQLLRRHKYPCKEEDFVLLKTVDRKFFHDEICKVLFEELGWNHNPYF